MLLLGILGVPAPTSQSKGKKNDMDAYLSLAELHLCQSLLPSAARDEYCHVEMTFIILKDPQTITAARLQRWEEPVKNSVEPEQYEFH